MYDVIIIGSGPGGMSAAIYSARANLKTLLIEKNTPGGQMINAGVIENYIGTGSKITGTELSMKMFEQVQENNVELKFDEIININKEKDYFKLQTKNELLRSKSVIIATGMQPKKMKIPGEKEFSNKGISWCAICDGNFFKDKEVAVIGGGDSALEEAHYLSKIAKKVYLIHRREEFRGQKKLEDRVRKEKNIELLLNKTVLEFKGKEKLSSLIFENNDNKNKTELKVDGAFIYIGNKPNTKNFLNLNITNDEEFIKTNNEFETKIKGLYAIGDVCDKKVRQIVIAVSEGAQAALKIKDYISALNDE